jgi:hypothetical protein
MATVAMAGGGLLLCLWCYRVEKVLSAEAAAAAAAAAFQHKACSK